MFTMHSIDDDETAAFGGPIAIPEDATTQLADGEKPKAVWIQLATSGQFAGHGQGPFELNATIFKQIIANFRATKNRQIPIDFNHSCEQDPTSGSIPTTGTPAQGWICDLKIVGNDLWALVEWGELARQYIRAGNYKFISPAIAFNAKDRVTGKIVGARLTSAGLTNQPFLDGMLPMAASENVSLRTVVEELQQRVKLLADRDAEAEVERAMRQHPTKVKPELQVHALAFAKSNPEGFRELFPLLDEPLARPVAPEPAKAERVPQARPLTLSEIARRIAVAERLSLADAQAKAVTLGARSAPPLSTIVGDVATQIAHAKGISLAAAQRVAVCLAHQSRQAAAPTVLSDLARRIAEAEGIELAAAQAKAMRLAAKGAA